MHEAIKHTGMKVKLLLLSSMVFFCSCVHTKDFTIVGKYSLKTDYANFVILELDSVNYIISKYSMGANSFLNEKGNWYVRNNMLFLQNVPSPKMKSWRIEKDSVYRLCSIPLKKCLTKQE